MTTTQRTRIIDHGMQLLAIFPLATVRDPIKLCKALRRLETAAHAFAERLCNGPEYPQEQEDKIENQILDRLEALLQWRSTGVPVFVNRDPRGYALKIGDSWMTAKNASLHRDWGGYGILAPEIE